MTSSLDPIPLGELAQFRGGNAFPKKHQGLSDGDYPFIKVSDLKLPGNERKITTANHWVSADSPLAKSSRLIPAGSSVFAKIGEGLRSERVRVTTRPTLLDNNLMAATAKPESCDPWFLFYLLQTIGLSALALGSALPYLRQSDLESTQVQVPSLLVQRRIASVLGNLDDLIDTDQDISARSGELWRALLDSHADKMQVPLSSLARFVNGRNFTKSATGSGRPVIRTPEVREGPGQKTTVRSPASASDDHVARRGDILFVWSGSLCVNRWIFEDGLVNQHVFKVLPADGVPAWVVMRAIEQAMAGFLAIAAGKATTMGHIKRDDLNVMVDVPARSTWGSLEEHVGPLWDAEMDYLVECETLRSARDELLPLLMSGSVVPGEVA